jgi:hypothetical protein
VHRVKIVKTRFTASTYNREATAHRSFNPGEVLIFLREENYSTFFARVDDIQANQPDPPRNLPEYKVESLVFEARVKGIASLDLSR